MRKGRPFVSLRPMSFITLRGGEVAAVFLAPIRESLRMGLIPVIHGDLSFDSVRGIAIVSADRIASLLGIRLRATRVLFGCDVDGVFSENPRIFPKASLVESVDRLNANSILAKLRNDWTTDATGSMLGKVKESIRLSKEGHECYIFNLTQDGLLREALEGKLSRGTRFMAWR